MMGITITPVDQASAGFAAQVAGIDIAAGVSLSQAAVIEEAMDRYGVLIFRDQVIDDQQQFAFSQLFGPMEQATGDIAQSSERRLSMNINDISNLDKSGKVLARDDRKRLFGLGNMLWHSDSSFKSIPAKYSLLSGRVVPERGGNTEFADMRAAWEALDPELQDECRDLVCEHSQLYSRASLGFDNFTDEEVKKWQPVWQQLVRTHPGSGRQSLFLSSHIGGIRGWPVPEARMFLRDLTEHATQPQFVYIHRWRQWDLLMWDNRALMHRARRYDHTVARDLHRTTVSVGEAASG